ncbi:MAG: carboxypeptidase-like regulatory domain-containing protein, partial [Halobacteriales archaeon]|nr:carboxypeptidase-like regulatory domain-containing protein [Halobacteriales archaeon]
DGSFNFNELQVGTYDLKVELQSFKTTVVSDIVLGVADIRELEVTMELGEISEEITVESPIVLVETIGGDVSTTITDEEITELPLNGRNFVQLTQLMPGVTAPDQLDFKNKGLLSGVDMSVSGSMATGQQWSVDGANNNDVGSNRTILVTPSVDAIEEFKIHRNSYSPEFGGAGGAQVNLVTKSGTNRYRGTAYYFSRNDSLNEKNALLEEAGQDKEELDFEDFGFTIGGPIVRDRVHFFGSQEWNDETRGTVRSAVVPTLAQRQGDFSDPGVPGCESPTPIDPLTGQPFPGNVIPPDRISEAGSALLELYPTPNTTPTANNCANWVASVPTNIEWNQSNARIDARIVDSARALVRYTRDDW